MRATPALRWARACVVAVVALGLGGVAHVAAGGELPGTTALVTVAVLVLVLSAAALGRPASYLRLAALVGGGQALVHTFLTAAAGHGVAHPESAAGVAGPQPVTAPQTVAALQGGVLDDLRVYDPTVVATPAGTPHWVDHLVDDLSGPHLAMAVAHLAAAALVAGWLFLGEAALWTTIGLVGRRVLLAIVATWWSYGPRAVTSLDDAVSRSSSVGSARRLLAAVRDGTAARRGPPRRPRLLASPVT